MSSHRSRRAYAVDPRSGRAPPGRRGHDRHRGRRHRARRLLRVSVRPGVRRRIGRAEARARRARAGGVDRAREEERPPAPRRRSPTRPRCTGRVLRRVMTRTESPARTVVTALGTTALLAVLEPDALEAAQRVMHAELAAIDVACSRFRPDSEISRLPAGTATPVGPAARGGHRRRPAGRPADRRHGRPDRRARRSGARLRPRLRRHRPRRRRPAPGAAGRSRVVARRLGRPQRGAPARCGARPGRHREGAVGRPHRDPGRRRDRHGCAGEPRRRRPGRRAHPGRRLAHRGRRRPRARPRRPRPGRQHRRGRPRHLQHRPPHLAARGPHRAPHRRPAHRRRPRRPRGARCRSPPPPASTPTPPAPPPSYSATRPPAGWPTADSPPVSSTSTAPSSRPRAGPRGEPRRWKRSSGS